MENAGSFVKASSRKFDAPKSFEQALRTRYTNQDEGGKDIVFSGNKAAERVGFAKFQAIVSYDSGNLRD